MRRFGLLVLGLLVLFSCTEEDTPTNPDNFNRVAVIERLADDLIQPSYADLNSALGGLESAFQLYKSNPSPSALDDVKQAWLAAYNAWQEAALWNFGPAESNGLIAAMNIYPADTVKIASNINGTYDLNSIGQLDAQGFPALEFLLYGSQISLQDNATSAYFEAVLNRMMSKAAATASDWQSFRSTFVQATGTDAGSALGMLFNSTFLPYLELHNREAKFGIPGGQRTGTAAPSKVEGLFSKTHSKELALTAFEAYRRAWLGMSHTTHVAGASVMDYVDYMDQRNGTAMSTKLQNQMDDVQTAIEATSNNYYALAQTNPQQLNNVWAAYQLMVFTIKTEVSSALNVTISYVDSDGD